MTKENIVNNNFKDVAFNRQSQRIFDPEVKISHEEFEEMIEQTTKAPSACNLQAWHFVIVDTPEGKEKLKKYFMKFNMPQVETCSAMVLLFGDTEAFKSYRDLWTEAYHNGQIDKAKLDEVFNTFLPLYENADYDTLVMDSAVDSSLAAMQFMLVARSHGYETNPIGGYDPKKAAEMFDLDPKRFVPVMAIAVGKKPKDYVDEVKSVRYPVKQVYNFA
ncbi:nitroreductase family protein [Lactobacillus sp. ESL0731]|uniref:nitroreductase family protein n=1 Tax=unclassified Lactobacillus TaxID=2620435 RepID=UPI0023F6DB49|nr:MULTISPECIES: nitroreductase family protein [unclassified Lactobacillus]WEV50387.1 nitroreductase family protein [Lactobacillus sp. ESL0700]WEV61517.1 nitroreductase family protein [Lactobacillus sp. ESL0731]